MEYEPRAVRGPANTFGHPARAMPRDLRPATLRVGVLLLAAGGWLMLAPSALAYTVRGAAVSDMVLGFLLALTALAGLVAPARMRWLGLVAALLGVWVLIAPFVLIYLARSAAAHDAIANDVVVGAVVVVLGVAGTCTQGRG